MKNYQDGFRNGWLDAKLGLTLRIALESTIPRYSDGYYDGQLAFQEQLYQGEVWKTN